MKLTTRIVSPSVSLLTIAILGCGTATTAPVLMDGSEPFPDTSGPAPETIPEDSIQLPDLGLDAVGDISEDLQTLDWEADSGIPLGEFGAPCEDNADCFSGYCVETSDGKICTMQCIDECPVGWTCAQNLASRPDLIYVCIPQFILICAPCFENSDCNIAGIETGAGCVDYGQAGAYCGAQCQESEDCPEGYDCAEAELAEGATANQCVLAEGQCECSQLAADLGATTDCLLENEHGTCPGQVTCTQSGPAECMGNAPSEESCDGLDNNCDGEIDEGLGETTCGVGECIHTVTNCDKGQTQECDPLQGSVPEQCDGADNDCDGETDEDFIDTDEDGTADCISPDDDGDGVLDETDNCPLSANPDQANFDLDTVGDACDPDDDNDLAADESDCEPFNPQVHPAAVEFCNGVDDNCNGQDDEGFGETTCGMGECQHSVGNCEEGQTQVCNPLEGALPEECDGLDNDCDGDADEGFSDNDSDGIADCVDGDDDNDDVPDDQDNCPTTSNPDQTDSDNDGYGDECDFGCFLAEIDDWEVDCDGVPDWKDNCIDVSNPGQADVDLDGLGDLCDDDDDNDGVPDAIDNCPSAANPGQADFDDDGVGDDCDGDYDGDGIVDLDDNCPGVPNNDQDDFDGDDEGDACDLDDDGDGEPDVVDCEPLNPAISHLAIEECNDVDDDCDGSVDESDAAGCEQYYLDLDQDGFGVAGQFKCLCNPDELYSTQIVGDCAPLAPAVFPDADEECNGIDDNCNEEIDEGYPNLDEDSQADCVDPDDDGDGVADVADNCPVLPNQDQADFDFDGAGNTCDEDDDDDGALDEDDCAPFDPDSFPGGIESCDSKDNDCNGEADDGLGISSCGVGECLHSVANCHEGQTLVCDPMEGSVPEECDGLDNDCDGKIDQGLGSTSCGLGVCEHTVDNCVGGFVQICDPMEGSAVEVCDGSDNNCNGETDEGVGGVFYLDQDNDGFGDAEETVQACEAPPEYVNQADDCDDDDDGVFPGAQELVNGKDDDCDGEGFHGVYVAGESGAYQTGKLEYTSFTIPEGIALTAEGGQFLEIYVLGTATLAGSLDLSGKNGENEQCGTSGFKLGGPGGGGGGHPGGKGGVHNGSGQVIGTTGGGPGGGGGGHGEPAGGGGGGAGYATQGEPGTEGFCYPPRCGSYIKTPGGPGGIPYSSPDLTGIDGGSGGGGGGGSNMDNGRGAGGGGGGGVLILQAQSLDVSGSITSNGGNGGSELDGCDGGGAGGGSGGTIWLRGDSVSISGQVKAKGGTGGITVEGPTVALPGPGGDGSDGRIRIDALLLEGTSDPAPFLGDF